MQYNYPKQYMPIICQNCGAVMKPLFLSLFCPNDCDRISINNSSKWLEFSGAPWKWQFISSQQLFPEDAKWGWWIFVESNISEILASKSSQCIPGWSITKEIREDQKEYHDVALVFK